ncbi:ATP-binding cassette permease MDL2 Ecym_3007 [Eremothecium cymbalariae DBVPG|uniref:ATP-dependent permease MDL2, mitochondrial n=1 Tax=Eremothecium cymbalariae (strain CBS 270.75 / DBVPG 7215 / KCTC 17166 / NRRL Y-17582) TaxID=931890 RepID=G8JQV7_ERECY|nr:Hypothetical protein Ecym_3007 [Eremothecium cymbalariae DBVPG\
MLRGVLVLPSRSCSRLFMVVPRRLNSYLAPAAVSIQAPRRYNVSLLAVIERREVVIYRPKRGYSSLSKTKKDNDGNGRGLLKDDNDTQVQKETSVGWREVLRLCSLAKHDWKLLAVAIGLLSVSCTIGMAVPKVIGLVLDATKNTLKSSYEKGSQDLEGVNEDKESLIAGPIASLDALPPIVGTLSITQFVGIFAGALVVGATANFGRVVLLKIIGERLVSRLRSQVIKRTMHHDIEFFDRNKVGDLISRFGSDAYVVSRSMTQNVSDGFKAIICGGVGMGMMFHISSTLTSVMLLFAPPLLVGAFIYGKKISAISRQLQQSSGNLTRVAEEQLNGIRTIKSFVAEKKEIRRYNDAIRQLFYVGKREAFTNATFFSSTTILGDMSFVIVLLYGANLVLQGALSIGDLTAFMLYTEYTGSSVFGLSTFYSELMKGAGAASRLFELMDHKNSVRSNISHALTPTQGKIEFRDVSFSYPTRPSNQIFKHMSFTIEPGSNVCIVGPSGKGKSTITSLLLRFYDPNYGSILIDNHDISKFTTKSLRRHLGVVQQEPTLMSGTIRDNITYGLSYTPTMDEIRVVSKQCFCHGFITKFPDGYDTVIGPRGASLSGGQRQRIAIARALIKKPKILILDEATSALDVESEGAINYTLGTLMRSKELTIISIAHRLSTIRRSENIIVVGNDGSVVEVGKFDKLYRNEESELFKLLNEKDHDLVSKSENTSDIPPDSPKNDDASGLEHLVAEDVASINDKVVKNVLNDITHDKNSSTLRP